ncbi:unnamed protein product, partial [Laminaria digitata]
REDDHQVGLKDDYDRLLVRRIFHEVAKTPGSNARVVSGKRGLDSGGDGREAHLLLFPKDVPDQLVVVDLYLSGHGGTGSVGGVHLNSAEDKGSRWIMCFRRLSKREGTRRERWL